jgi:hypothetical protein
MSSQHCKREKDRDMGWGRGGEGERRRRRKKRKEEGRKRKEEEKKKKKSNKTELCPELALLTELFFLCLQGLEAACEMQQNSSHKSLWSAPTPGFLA